MKRRAGPGIGSRLLPAPRPASAARELGPQRQVLPGAPARKGGARTRASAAAPSRRSAPHAARELGHLQQALLGAQLQDGAQDPAALLLVLAQRLEPRELLGGEAFRDW